ncbi:MAG: hypothetical protein Q9182_001127 [Xanthomendoza sp. 2 TL-2023]
MRYLPCLLAGAFGSLLVLAQDNKPVNALYKATTEYKEIRARLVEVNSDCERSLANPLDCNGVFANVATDINQANSQLDTVAQTFVPKLQGNITTVNKKLRDIACSTAPKTQAAAKLNAEAIRRAISDQIVKIDLIGSLFAKNNACNNKQSPAALQKFAKTVQTIDADDKKTAQSFTPVGGTLGCVV